MAKRLVCLFVMLPAKQTETKCEICETSYITFRHLGLFCGLYVHLRVTVCFVSCLLVVNICWPRVCRSCSGTKHSIHFLHPSLFFSHTHTMHARTRTFTRSNTSVHACDSSELLLQMNSNKNPEAMSQGVILLDALLMHENFCCRC